VFRAMPAEALSLRFTTGNPCTASWEIVNALKAE